MNRDTRPDGHHGKNNPPKPTKQSDRELPATRPLPEPNSDAERADNDRHGLIAWGREM